MKKEHIMGIGLIVLIAGLVGAVVLTAPISPFQTDTTNESVAGQIQ